MPFHCPGLSRGFQDPRASAAGHRRHVRRWLRVRALRGSDAAGVQLHRGGSTLIHASSGTASPASVGNRKRPMLGVHASAVMSAACASAAERSCVSPAGLRRYRPSSPASNQRSRTHEHAAGGQGPCVSVLPRRATVDSRGVSQIPASSDTSRCICDTKAPTRCGSIDGTGIRPSLVRHQTGATSKVQVDLSWYILVTH